MSMEVVVGVMVVILMATRECPTSSTRHLDMQSRNQTDDDI